MRIFAGVGPSSSCTIAFERDDDHVTVYWRYIGHFRPKDEILLLAAQFHALVTLDT